MLESRPITTEASNARLPFTMKQYAREGPHVVLKKNWRETWCTLPQAFDTVLPEILDYEVRPDDVFIVTFIKCGTTWMQETAWLLMNNLDFEKSKNSSILERSPFIDFHGIIVSAPNIIEFSQTLPSPRLIKSHMPANLLPRQIWECKQKTIYVARNCKDVVVSSYHFTKNLGLWCGDSFEDYVTDFLHNEIIYTSYWTHVVDFWKMRHEPFIFFTTYEEMKRDLAGVVQGLCEFLGRPQLTAVEMEKTLKHLSFDNMRALGTPILHVSMTPTPASKNCVHVFLWQFSHRSFNTSAIRTRVHNFLTPASSINVASLYSILHAFIMNSVRKQIECEQFMRRGIVGSFKDELTPELQAKIDEWSRMFLAQHGLTEEDIFGRL